MFRFGKPIFTLKSDSCLSLSVILRPPFSSIGLDRTWQLHETHLNFAQPLCLSIHQRSELKVGGP